MNVLRELKAGDLLMSFNSNVTMLVITFPFFFLYLFYFLISLNYVYKNLINKTRKIMINWIDYLLILFFIITFCFIYIIYLSVGNEKYFWLDDQTSSTGAKRTFILDNGYGIACYIVLVMLMFFINNILILDVCKCINAMFIIKKVLKIKSENLGEISKLFRDANIMSTIGAKNYFIQMGCVLVVNIAFGFRYIYTFFEEKFSLKALLVVLFVFKIIMLVSIILLYLNAFLVRYYKKKLLESTFHSHNLILLKVYNVNISKIVYITDYLNFKCVIDFIANIPLILFFTIGRLDRFPAALSFFCLLLYAIFSGAMYLYVDGSLKNSHITKLVKKAFFLKKFNFNFGERERAKLFEEFDFDYSEDESRIFQELNMTILEQDKPEEEQPKIDLVNIKEERESRKTRRTTFKELFGDNFEINSCCNYFIIYKLLYQYFYSNRNIYLENQRKMEDEAAPFKMFLGGGKDNMGSSFNLNFRTSTHKDILDNIQRISRISKLAERKISSSFKIGFNTLFLSLEEKEYRDEFKKKYNLADCSTIEFTIESLFNDILFELFPFYQINIKDLLTSIDPSANKKLFQDFLKDNSGDQAAFLSSSNGFYTYDSFLFFESYDSKSFSFDQLKSFLKHYHDYLLDVIKNVSYTFIPLIIGVYNVEVLGLNRLVILYRHPLSFAPCAKFNHWINFAVTEAPEKIKVSANNTDIIDINEIEIKNNIKLHSDEYEEVKKILQNDLDFIVNKMNFGTYPIGNLFVGNEITNTNSFINESSDNNNITNENKTFNSILKDTFLFDTSMGGVKKQKKDGGSEIISLFEKEYYMANNDNVFTIKIYFTNFFRKTCELNEKEPNEKLKLKSKDYCDYVQNLLLGYLHKNDKLFGSSILSDSNIISSNRNTVKEENN